MFDVPSYLLGKKSGGGSQGLTVVVVEELPTTGQTNILYLVPKTTSETNNIFDEYLYTEDGWELIGSTDIDLSNYVDMTSAQSISGKKIFTTLPESSVAPTTNNQLSNKKYVDDGLSEKQGTIDSSNKLDADLVDDTNSTHKFFSGDSSDLLHYKGHVASEGDLPSLGQPSYPTPSQYEVTITSRNYNYFTNTFKNDSFTYDLIYNQAGIANIRANNTYYLATRTTNDEFYLGIGYENSETVKIKVHSIQGNTTRFSVSINASQENPVQLYQYNSKTSSTTYVKYYNDPNSNTPYSIEGSVNTTTTLTSPMVFHFEFTRLITNATVKYAGNITSVLGHTDDWVGSSLQNGETLYIATDLSGIYQYRYADGYKFINPSQIDVLNLVSDTTTTKLNDTWTVGNNYDIYRRNENTQWDKFSKSPDVVTTISSSSTNSDVPSALAVYNYVNSLNGNGVAY